MKTGKQSSRVAVWLQVRRILTYLKPRTSLTPFEAFLRDGYKSLVLNNLPLTDTSLAIEFGGYLGDYAHAIYSKYNCRVHVFEPVPYFSTQLARRFNNTPVLVQPCMLADEDGIRWLQVSGDATGEFAAGAKVCVEVRSAQTYAATLPDRIGLVAINIEGGEYELIPVLASAGILERTDIILVQFHKFQTQISVDDCRAILRLTHDVVFSYEYVWEMWRRREL